MAMAGLWIKRIGITMLIAAIVGALAYAFREKPVPVDTGTVEAGPMTVAVLQEGITRVRDIYTISTPIAGHLSRTTLEVGDPVRANETTVASIHPLVPPLLDARSQAELLAARDAARASVAIAQVDLQRARTARQQARAELDRLERLARSGTVPERSVENARSEVELQEAQVSSAEATISLRNAEMASAQARLMQPGALTQGAQMNDCCVRLTAPADGMVLQVFAQSEQAVEAGARIAEIGDPTDLEIVVDLLSADAVRITAGTLAAITEWGGEEALQAVVRRIEPAGFKRVSALGIEEQRVNAILDLDSPPDMLGHEYRVVAEIPIWSSENAIQVPISSLFRVGARWMVFRLEGERVRQVPVSVGHMNATRAEIIEGLGEGDVVVLHPSDRLADGSLVGLRPDE